jgi:murein DD-endopeptidase MepM/ murein hydrolase activator NlpD
MHRSLTLALLLAILAGGTGALLSVNTYLSALDEKNLALSLAPRGHLAAFAEGGGGGSPSGGSTSGGGGADSGQAANGGSTSGGSSSVGGSTGSNGPYSNGGGSGTTFNGGSTNNSTGGGGSNGSTGSTNGPYLNGGGSGTTFNGGPTPKTPEQQAATQQQYAKDLATYGEAAAQSRMKTISDSISNTARDFRDVFSGSPSTPPTPPNTTTIFKNSSYPPAPNTTTIYKTPAVPQNTTTIYKNSVEPNFTDYFNRPAPPATTPSVPASPFGPYGPQNPSEISPTGKPPTPGQITINRVGQSPISVNNKPVTAQDKPDRQDEFGAVRPNDRLHAGVDIDGQPGDKITMNVNGTVVRADNADPTGYGTTVDVRLPSGDVVRMTHLGSENVSVGQQVGPGDQIGTIGRTGVEDSSVPTHVHTEVIQGDVYTATGGKPGRAYDQDTLNATRVDPARVLTGAGSLVASNVPSGSPQGSQASTQTAGNTSPSKPATPTQPTQSPSTQTPPTQPAQGGQPTQNSNDTKPATDRPTTPSTGIVSSIANGISNVFTTTKDKVNDTIESCGLGCRISIGIRTLFGGGSTNTTDKPTGTGNGETTSPFPVVDTTPRISSSFSDTLSKLLTQIIVEGDEYLTTTGESAYRVRYFTTNTQYFDVEYYFGADIKKRYLYIAEYDTTRGDRPVREYVDIATNRSLDAMLVNGQLQNADVTARTYQQQYASLVYLLAPQ